MEPTGSEVAGEETIVGKNEEERSKKAVAMEMHSANLSKHKPKVKNIKEVICYNCGKKGHMAKHCRASKKERIDMKTDSSKESKPPKRDNSGNHGQKRTNYAVVAKAGCATVVSKQDECGRELILDTGASFHMTGIRSWLKKYIQLDSDIPIQVGNRNTLFAVGKRTVRVISKVNNKTFEVDINAYYVPGISDNLFSQESADEKGVSFKSREGMVELYSGDEIIMRGQKKNANMFILDVKTPRSSRANEGTFWAVTGQFL